MENKIEGVIFIQYTDHSELAKVIRKRLEDLEKVGRIKVKLVERTGNKIVDLLHKSDAWGDSDCMRDDCWTCQSCEKEEKPKGKCKRRSILYETYCETCEDSERIIGDGHPTKRQKCRENKGDKTEMDMGVYGMEFFSPPQLLWVIIILESPE